MFQDKIVSDAIFGFITLKPHIVVIIDTPEFQRLRSIWQLGVTPFVYPTADHCRFEHSIGTYWLASRLVTKLQGQLENELVISDLDVKCVEIAALCHDLGHGPFSHTWDNTVLPNVCGVDTFKHDKHFDRVWEVLKTNTKVKDMLRNNFLNESHEQLIMNLINGQTVEGKEILCSIISNSESGMDVDKWDYLARDATYLGHATTNYRVDIERMMHRARAIKDENGTWKIAFRKSESINMLRVFQLRHYMHKTAYQHRKVVAIELMFLDGIKECIDKGILKKDEIGTVNWILKNTDAVFWTNTKQISAFERIFNREFYKQICTAERYDCIEDPNPTEELRKDLEDKLVEVKYLRFAFSKFRLGSNEGNPITKIPFYERKEKVFYFSEDKLPSYLRMNFDESRLMVFFDGKGYCEDIQRDLVTYLARYKGGEINSFYLDSESETFKEIFAVFDSNDPIKDTTEYLSCTDFGANTFVVVICHFKNSVGEAALSVHKKHAVKGWLKCCETSIKPYTIFNGKVSSMVLLFEDFDVVGVNRKIKNFLDRPKWIFESTP